MAFDDIASVREPQHVGQADEAVHGVIALDQLPALGDQVFRDELKSPLPGEAIVRRTTHIGSAIAARGLATRRHLDARSRLWMSFAEIQSKRRRHIQARAIPKLFDIIKIMCWRGVLVSKVIRAARMIVGGALPIFPLIRMISQPLVASFLATVTEVSHLSDFALPIPQRNTEIARISAVAPGERAGALQPVRFLIELYRTQLVLISAKLPRLSAMAIFLLLKIGLRNIDSPGVTAKNRRWWG